LLRRKGILGRKGNDSIDNQSGGRLRGEIGSVFDQLARGGWSIAILFYIFFNLLLCIALTLGIVVGEGRKGIDLTLILVLNFISGMITLSRVRRRLYIRGMR
jgi:hypothetical protein